MSLKRFNGWEPATETRYERDGDGQVARAVTTREAEWDTNERGLAMALLELEADRCGGCGRQLTDTTDPGSEYAWHVPPPTRCHACTAIARAQEPYAEAKHPNALLWAVDKR